MGPKALYKVLTKKLAALAGLAGNTILQAEWSHWSRLRVVLCTTLSQRPQRPRLRVILSKLSMTLQPAQIS